jgi:hypothetical protein
MDRCSSSILLVPSTLTLVEYRTLANWRDSHDGKVPSVPSESNPEYTEFKSRLDQNKAFYIIVIGIPAGVILGITINAALLAARRSLVRRRIAFLDQEIAEISSKGLQATLEDDFLTKLVKINFTYIDRYYGQIQEQANKSFTLSAVVSVIAYFPFSRASCCYTRGRSSKVL